MHADHVRRIKERLDIVEFIGDYVPLKKAGRSFKGLCPFHGEKTPSFTVSPERQTYHCFGCGRGGDIFSFVMETEGISFSQALELLASRAGVSLEPVRQGASGGDVRSVSALAQEFFTESLSGSGGISGRHYLAKRNVPEHFWKEFGLGWAPSGWDSLWRHLRSRNVGEKDALACGVVVEGNRGLYDRFRGRVIFPITDVSGRIIAFGGRLVDGDGAKYLNSPEGVLFRKRECLYLLHRAKQFMRARGRAILVEGYMDALRLHMEGFGEAVASLGTALTSEQADLVKRFAPRCYICFDADAAGQEAAVRGMYVLQSRGLDVRVVSLPEAKDPDEFLSAPGGSARFAACLDEAMPLVRHHLSLRRDALRDPTQREQATRDILSGVAQLSSLDLAPFVPEVAAAFGLFAHQLVELVERERKFLSQSEQGKPALSGVSITGGKGEEAADPVEAALLFLLWTDASRRRNASPEAILPFFSEERLRHIVMALLSGELPEELEARWHVIGETYPLRMVAFGGEWCARLEEKDAWKTVVGLLEARNRKRQYEALQLKCRRGEATDEDLLALRNLAQKLKGGKDSA